MADKKTIGLTNENREITTLLIERGFFKDQMDVAKFAFSLAIKKGIDEIPPGTYDTTWNVGSFDSDGKMKALVLVIEPNLEEPYRKIETIANQGLHYIRKHYEENNDILLEELLA